MGQAPLTFSANGVAGATASTVKALGLSQLFAAQSDTPTHAGGNIYQAEMLAKEGKRSEAIAHAFSKAQGPEVNALNLFYANHASTNPKPRLYFLNKYLAIHGLQIQLEDSAEKGFFHQIKSAQTQAKVDGPLVTVIMPAHNAERTIELAVGSLLNQTWQNLQIIVVDDASTDGTLQKAKDLAKRDPRVEVLTSPVNVGPYVCRNLGVLHTRGQWLTVHDADDWAFPDRIEQQIQALTAANALACTGRMLRMNEQGQITRPIAGASATEVGYLRLCFVSLMVQTAYFRYELGAWDSVRVGGDAELIERLKVLGTPQKHLRRPLMLCLDHEASLTNHQAFGLSDKTGQTLPLRADYKQAFTVWHKALGPKKILAFEKARPFDAPKKNLIDQGSIDEIFRALKKNLPLIKASEMFDEASVPTTTLLQKDALQPHAVSASNQMSMAEAVVAESLAAFTGAVPTKSDLSSLSLPKVSVIMTAHNAAATVRRSVESMLLQSWLNIEIVIVDDASTDETWTILSAMAQRHKSFLRAIRLETNLGTYIAKNIAISESKGEIIIFQDSDDHSHPDRVAIQAWHLVTNPQLLGNRTKYCRFNPSTGLAIPVAGHLTKSGLITVAVRRAVFDRIGYFDAVRRAGDDEWFGRARVVLGSHLFASLNVALYLAELRQNSLAQDLFRKAEDGGITQIVSGDRAEYGRSVTARHAKLAETSHNLPAENPPLPFTAPQWVPESIAAIPRSRPPVIASMCSIPSRSAALRKSVASIINQVDRLYIYLDKYQNVPDFLNSDSRITVTRSQAVNKDLKDNAKFLTYNALKAELGEFFMLTIDDDIQYPPDYVRHHLAVSEANSYRCVTGLHGVIYDDIPNNYFNRRIVHHYRKDRLQSHKLVNALGTGTTGFHSRCFPSIDPFLWERGGMVDIYFSILARQSLVPMLCISRAPNWLRDLEETVDGPTLYQEFLRKDELIVSALMPFAPWGYQAIFKTLVGIPKQERWRLAQYLPAFADHIEASTELGKYAG